MVAIDLENLTFVSCIVFEKGGKIIGEIGYGGWVGDHKLETGMNKKALIVSSKKRLLPLTTWHL